MAKPAFASHMMELNTMMYELGLTKTLSNNIQQLSRPWEIEEFKADQKKARSDASRHYDVVVEKVI